MAEVSKHNTKEDAWIAVNGKVYDITEFINNHPGWEVGGSVSTVLAIVHGLGQDVSADFKDIHTRNAWEQLPDYYIGDLVHSDSEATGPPRHRKNHSRVRWPSDESLATVLDAAEPAKGWIRPRRAASACCRHDPGW